jgi:hypothetical protein
VRNARAECISPRRRRLGTYGQGTLWCLRSRNGLFMLFNDSPIAKRERPSTKAWLPLDASWIVTSLDGAQVLVQHNDDEGVIVSLGLGKCPDTPRRFQETSGRTREG